MLCVTALGDSRWEKRKQAYAALFGKIEMPQSFNRTDIGGKEHCAAHKAAIKAKP